MTVGSETVGPLEYAELNEATPQSGQAKTHLVNMEVERWEFVILFLRDLEEAGVAIQSCIGGILVSTEGVCRIPISTLPCRERKLEVTRWEVYERGAGVDDSGGYSRAEYVAVECDLLQVNTDVRTCWGNRGDRSICEADARH